QAERAEYLMADRGYDGKPLIDKIERRSITAIIDNRHMWKDGELTRQYKETDLIYDEDGRVFFIDDCGKSIPLIYEGYDSSTDSLQYKFHPKYSDCRIFRIKRSEDVRIFPKVARTSYKFKRLYKKRTAVERVNSRLDRDFLFEDHTIRGLDKMNLYVSISFIVSLAFASAKVKENIVEHLASWVA
ncbi:transposase, partial [Alkalibacterium sp. s-m-28]